MSLHIEDKDKKNLGEVKQTVSVSTEELRRLHEIDAIEAYQKEVDDVAEKMMQCQDIEFNMETELDYIKWVTQFVKKHENFETDHMPDDLNDEDKKNIDKLFIFYGLIHKHAHKLGLAQSCFTYMPGERVHTVSYKDTSFIICEFEDGAISLKANKGDKVQFDYEDIINEGMKNAMKEFEECKNDPEFVNNISEALKDIDKEIKEDLENTVKKPDKIDEIAQEILWADREKRDEVIFKNFPILRDEYERILKNIVDATQSTEDEKLTMRIDTNYIDWLSKRVDESKVLEDSIIKGTPEEVKNLKKLGLFYEVILKYAKDHGIGERASRGYTVKYNDICFMISKSEMNSVYATATPGTFIDVDYENLMQEAISSLPLIKSGTLDASGGNTTANKLILESKEQTSEGQE